MEKIQYITYIPAGNDTAFVLKRGYTPEQKKKINDAIMQKESNILNFFHFFSSLFIFL